MTASEGTRVSSKARQAFGDFVLDHERGALFGPDGELRLRPKAYAVLAYLLEHPGQLVSKETLLQAVWGRAIVTEDSLTQCLVEIRRVLGGTGHEVIRTVPRRGYLFAAEVTVVDHGAAGAPEEKSPTDALAETTLGPPGGRDADATRTWRPGFGSIAAGLVVVAMLLFSGWRAFDLPEPATSEAAAFAAEDIADRGPSVAVLPFVDMSPGGDHAYFGDGMAEEIINLLANAQGLRVIARTSSFALRDARIDVPAMGQRLGVAHILEGSVRPDGDRVRVTAQLVDASDGTPLWSETYDRDLVDLLALQDDIAMNVASSLHAGLSRDGAVRHQGQPVVAPQAHEHKLRGRHLFSRRHIGDLEGAVAHFEAAVALEPEYAEAWVGLAGARWVLMHQDGVMEENELSAHRAAALRGVELGPSLPEAHLRAMQAHRLAGDLAAVERHLQIARELDPQNTLLLGMAAGQSVSEGLMAEAIDFQSRALRGDPLSLTVRGNLATFLLAAGRIEEARHHLDVMGEIGARDSQRSQTLELNLLLREGRYAEAWALAQGGSGDEEWTARMAMTLHALGRPDEALEAVAALAEADSYQAAFALAEFHAWRGDADAALGWLEQARARLSQVSPMRTRPTWLHMLTLSPFLDPLKDNVRFGEIKTMPL